MSAADDFDPFAGPQLEATYPATEAQQEVWTASRWGRDASCAFNESVSLRLRGPLQVAAFEQALACLVAHHEALRTTFAPLDATLCVAARLAVPVGIEDLTTLDFAARDARRLQVLADEVSTPFDLEAGPLVRFRLLRLGPEDYWFTLTAHHLVCDGWSMAVLLEDLATAYSALAAGRPPALPRQPFRDYIAWQAGADNRDARTRAEAYWLERLRGELPPLELPLDHPRPAVKTYRADRIDQPLPPELVTRLRATGARAGASFLHVLLAGFAALLHRLTGQTDLILGVPAAGQSVSGLDRVVGHCVNLLPLRVQPDPAGSFADLLRAVRADMLDAYDHQAITFSRLLSRLTLPRDPARSPLVAVAFNLDQAVEGSRLPFPGLTAEFSSNPRRFENFEIFINASEAGGRVTLECQYNADLFDHDTVRDRLESFQALLEGAAADVLCPVRLLPVLSREQQQTLLVDWNATALDYPHDRTVVDLLDEGLTRHADRPALTVADTTWSYRELHDRAGRWAAALRARGVGRGDRVAVCLPREAEAVAVLLGVLKAGAAYVPLDPAHPPERLGFMATDSGAGLAVTTPRLQARVPASIDRLLVGMELPAAGSDPSPARPQDPAYLLYTSGSTGQPKGVLVAHGNVVNLFHALRRTPGVSADDVVLAVTTFAFDMSVGELWLTLWLGGRIVLADQETVSDGPVLRERLESSGATLMEATPALWRLLVEAGWGGSPRLRAWCAGEKLPPDLAAALLSRVAELWNLYGPTEVTVYSTAARVVSPDDIRIGRPLANIRAYILDAHRQPVPVGVTGELFHAGAGVAPGYHGRPELTAERFVENPWHDPFADHLNPRLYRTGDLMRWRPGGVLDYLGRNDTQVKLRGYRIELGEIEALLARQPGVRQVVVQLRTDRPADPRLAAYVVVEPGHVLSAGDLRKALRARVPDYMVPQHIVELPSLPLSANGKIDRQRLPSPFAEQGPAEDSPEPPRGEVEGYLAGVWADALGQTGVGREGRFFQLGGHSLLAFQVLARIERDTGVRLPPRALVLNSLAQVAGQLEALRARRTGEGHAASGR